MNIPFWLWFQAFLWTYVLELPIYSFLLRRKLEPWWHIYPFLLGLNLITHPALNYLFPRFQPFWLWVLVGESLVVLVEGSLVALVLRSSHTPLIALRNGLFIAFCANAFSTAMGFLIFWT